MYLNKAGAWGSHRAAAVPKSCAKSCEPPPPRHPLASHSSEVGHPRKPARTTATLHTRARLACLLARQDNAATLLPHDACCSPVGDLFTPHGSSVDEPILTLGRPILTLDQPILTLGDDSRPMPRQCSQGISRSSAFYKDAGCIYTEPGHLYAAATGQKGMPSIPLTHPKYPTQPKHTNW
eukprot:1051952-Pelagomonas_calceolata.AAC.1